MNELSREDIVVVTLKDDNGNLKVDYMYGNNTPAIEIIDFMEKVHPEFAILHIIRGE